MKNILSIQRKLQTINKKCYIVGGFCRDYFLAQKKVGYENFHTLQDAQNIQSFQNTRKDGDVDLVTDATPDEMKEVLKIVGEVGKKYGTCIVSEGGEAFELTTFRKDIGSVNNRKPAEVEFTHSLEEDSLRRDFRCNSIYYDLESEEFIDPQGGIPNIESGVIRFVGDAEKRIEEDVIRILRFVRFKNKYGFKIGGYNEGYVGNADLHSSESKDNNKVGIADLQSLQYMEILKKTSHLLKNIPAERIRQELDKILMLSVGTGFKPVPTKDKHLSPNIQALQDLKDIDFFKHIIPELNCLDQCLGNKYHLEGDVWVHTKMCVEELNIVIKRENIGDERALMLLWAILLHDIGKHPTYSVSDDGEGHYYDHERVGAAMFKRDLVTRLKFSNEMAKKIEFIIKEHLRVFLIPEMKKCKSRKLMMHDFFEDLLLMSEADNNGRIPAKEDAFTNICRIYSEFKEILKTKKFLTGEDIMKRYPELEGRDIGERLEQLNNQILVRDE